MPMSLYSERADVRWLARQEQAKTDILCDKVLTKRSEETLEREKRNNDIRKHEDEEKGLLCG